MGITSEEQKRGLDESLKALNLSNDECDKFAKAFKDPEFIKMFEEYAREVSDPKVKAETDQYLRQLEMEGRIEEVYGKGAQIIMPEPAFVLKTINKVNGMKIFINVCTSDKLDKASLKEATDANGRKGKSLDMPLCLGPKKDGKGKDGEPCCVWDFVIHPDTLAMTTSNAVIRDAMIGNAVEKIEANNKGVDLERNTKTPKINGNYKGTESCPQPHALAMRGPGGSSVDGRVKPLDQNARAPIPPSSSSQPSSLTSSSSEDDSSSRSSFAFSNPKSKSKPPAPPISNLTPTQSGFKHETGEVTPQWEIIHRGQVDLGEAWGDANRAISINTTHPKELVLRVVLPGITSAAGVDLEVSRNQVTLGVPSKYKLTATLPYPVDSERGKAKFDKARNTLEVVMPVIVPPPPVTPRAMAAGPSLVELLDPVEEQKEMDGKKEEAVEECSVNKDGEEGPLIVLPAEKTSEEASTGGKDAHQAEKEEMVTENEKRWAELHASSTPASLPQSQAEEASTRAPPAFVPPPIKPRLQASLADELD